MDMIDILVIPSIKVLIVFGILVIHVPFLVLVERKIIGRIQQRPGPNRVGLKLLFNDLRRKEIPKGKPFFGFWGGILQTIIDGAKLALKEDLIPDRANKAIFIISPIIVLVPAFLTFMIVPLGPTFDLEIAGKVRTITMSVTELPIGILFYLAISSLGVYGIVLAGWSSNSKYALLGGLRSSAQLISYELSLGLSIVGVLLLAGSFEMDALIQPQESGIWAWYIWRQPLGAMIFLIGGFAETNRLPFDLPEGETELGAGFHTEYSSLKWATFMLGEYVNILTFAAMMTTLFLGGYHGPILIPALANVPVVAVLSGLFWFFLKVWLIFFFFVWVRGTLPRLRYDQLMNFGWKILFPLALLNVMVTAGIIAAGMNGVVTGIALFIAGFGIIALADRRANQAKARFLSHAS